MNLPLSDKQHPWLTVVVAIIITVPGVLAYFKTSETHDLVNSRLSELLPIIRQGAADAATLKEKADQAAREAAEAKAIARAAAATADALKNDHEPPFKKSK